MITVSAHAIVRWLERVDGLNLDGARAIVASRGLVPTDGLVLQRLIDRGDGALVEMVRDAILSEKAKVHFAMGCRRVPIDNSAVLVLDGNVVVTVVPPKSKSKLRCSKNKKRRQSDKENYEHDWD